MRDPKYNGLGFFGIYKIVSVFVKIDIFKMRC